MNVVKQSKYITFVLAVVTLLLVGWALINAYLSNSITFFDIRGAISFESFTSWSLEQLGILIWEGFWITFGAFIVYRLVKNAKNKPSEATVKKLERLEKSWILTALVGLTFLALITIPIAAPYLYGPYTTKPSPDAQIVVVTASQFNFIISSPNSNPQALDSNRMIDFRLNTTDVTHGFGLYDEKGKIFIQAQIVPGYTTKIRINLPPGQYQIICLEYCGVGHHGMATQLGAITVV